MTLLDPAWPRAARRRHARALGLLILIVLLANGGILSGAFNCEPRDFFIGLATMESPAPTGAACFVDPAVAYFTQTMGYLSAQDWLHGIVPWWNPYSGAGLPLAAEVQNESFFLPFVLLLHFQSGWLIQRLLFQLCSGWLTYGFLRLLGLREAAATLGAALFSLNGSFTLTAGTVSAPIMFLPLLLIGIEFARAAAIKRRPMGWSLICLAVAGGIYAGFPETAYFDDLLGGSWMLLRLWQTPGARRRLLGKFCLAVGIGLALTAPMMLPFLDYLHIGYAGLHGGYLARSTVPAAAAPLQLLPLFYGAIAHFTPALLAAALGSMWVRIGGWFGCGPVLLALAALAAPNPARRAERYLLAGWVLLWEARCFGVPGATALVNLIPGAASTDAIRYAPLSLEFCVFVLAAFGLDDLAGKLSLPRHRMRWVAGGCLLLLCLAVLPACRYLPAWFAAYPRLLPMAGASLLGTAFTLALLLYTLRTGRGVMACWTLMITGAAVVFLLPQLNGFRAVRFDRTGVGFLQTHAGLSRFMSVGPLGANFPAAYGVAGVNAMQLPVPANWNQYYNTKLVGVFQDTLNGAALATEISVVMAHLANFQAVGVKYLGVRTDFDTIGLVAPAVPAAVRPVLAFHSQVMNIYQLPGPARYFSASDPGCRLVVRGRQALTSACPAAAMLTRLELFYPGWHAVVNGAAVPVRPSGPIFQAVGLPAGSATIQFFYRPPGTRLNCAVALLAALLWAGLAARARANIKTGRGRRTAPPSALQ